MHFDNHSQIIVYKKGIVLLLFVMLSGILAYHNRYSFCQSDESLYAALCHRVYLGEGLFSDEWHPVQVFTPVIYPFYYLFKSFVPSGDGILLFFRQVYLLISSLVSISSFCIFKKEYGFLPSLFSSVCILLYSRANIHGMSYYNLCFLSVIAAILCFTRDKHQYYFSALGSVFISVSVICSPYLALPVFLIWLFVLLFCGSRRKCAVITAFGILICFLAYVSFVLRAASLSSILTNIKFILRDPGHQFSVLEIYSTLHRQTFEVIGNNTLVYLVLSLLLLLYDLWNYSLSGKCRKTAFIQYQLYFVIILLISKKSLYTASGNICYSVTYPFSLILFPLSLRRIIIMKKADLANILYFAGLIVSGCFAFSSNTGLDAMTIGFTISSIGGILSLFQSIQSEQINSLYKKSLLVKEMILLITLLIIYPFTCHRFLGIYRDGPLYRLTCPLSDGPAAGLFTTEDHKTEYETILSAIKEVHTLYPHGEVIFSKTLPWAYLCTDWHYGSPSAWSNIISEDSLINDYYIIHPDKQPDLIFVFEPFVGGYYGVPFNNHSEYLEYNKSVSSGQYAEIWLNDKNLIIKNKYVSVYLNQK